MKRVLAFLLVLCGTVAFLAPPAVADTVIAQLTEKITDNPALLAALSETGVLLDADGVAINPKSEPDNLSGIVQIDLTKASNFASITSLADIKNATFSKLTVLNAAGAVGVKTGPTIDASWTGVDLSGSKITELTLPAFSGEKADVNLSECSELTKLTLDVFATTGTGDDDGVTLNLSGTGLTEIDTTAATGGKIVALDASNCAGLATVKIDAKSTANLKSLSLSGCGALTAVGTSPTAGSGEADLSIAAALEELNLNGCSKLTALAMAANAAAATKLASMDVSGSGLETMTLAAGADDIAV